MNDHDDDPKTRENGVRRRALRNHMILFKTRENEAYPSMFILMRMPTGQRGSPELVAGPTVDLSVIERKLPQPTYEIVVPGRIKYDDNGHIRLLRTAEERAKPGTPKYKQFCLYQKDMTVKQFLDRGGVRNHLERDIKYGHIAVD